MYTRVGRDVGTEFLDEMLNARKHVYVVSRWISPEYAERLVELARCGVAVRILTSDDRNKVHQKAVRPPIWARIKGWEPPNLEIGIIREKYLHVKMYVFDDKKAIVGSANLTKSGMFDNIEHIVIFDRSEEVQMIKRDFKKLWRLYAEDREVARQVVSLADIAKTLGKTVQELLQRL